MGVSSSFRGSSRPRDRTCVSCPGRWILYHCATWEAQLHFIHFYFPAHSHRTDEVQLPILRVTCARSLTPARSSSVLSRAPRSAQSAQCHLPSLPRSFCSSLQVRVPDTDTFPTFSKRLRADVPTDVVLGPVKGVSPTLSTAHAQTRQVASSSGSSHCAPGQFLGCTADTKRCSGGLWSLGRRARPRPRVEMQPRVQAQV